MLQPPQKIVDEDGPGTRKGNLKWGASLQGRNRLFHPPGRLLLVAEDLGGPAQQTDVPEEPLGFGQTKLLVLLPVARIRVSGPPQDLRHLRVGEPQYGLKLLGD